MSHAPWSVCLCVMCTPVSPAKTDKPIEMRVVADAWCPRSHVLRIERSVHGSAPAVGVGGALSDTAIRRSVCLSQGVAAVGYRHAGCLLLSHRRPVPEMYGLQTRPRTDVDPPRVELPSAGAYRLAAPGAIACTVVVGYATSYSVSYT